MPEKRAYDLVFSLGGNCSAAHNLRYRKLRPFSLPLDWLYIVDERPIAYLARGFADRFADFCRQENLREIRPGMPEYASAHADRVQYVDEATGYRFVNHFNRSADEPAEYARVRGMMDRRIDRLYDALNHGKRFLLLLATAVDVRECTLRVLLVSLRQLFPGKVFEIEYLHFGQKEESVVESCDLTVRSFQREQNDYDFYHTNWEWHFLDDVKVLRKPTRRRKVSFHLLPGVKCIIRRDEPDDE